MVDYNQAQRENFSIHVIQGGSGYVRSVRFENVRMEDVENPIIIDQFYCDSPTTCETQVLYSLKIQNLASNQTVTSNIRPYSRTVCSLFIIEFNAFCFCQTSAVKISQIMYRNISGTTTSKNAMKFACSDSVPCSNIILSNVNLEKTDGTVETYCHAAQGFGYGIVHPSADCLTSSDNNFAASDQTQVLELETVQLPTEQHIVHTEL